MAKLSKETIAAAKRYGHTVDDIAQQYGISGAALLAKVVSGESGDNPDAVSSAGARGRVQFMPASRDTAVQKYGVDPWSKDADQAVHAAALHLRGLINGSKGLQGYNPGSSTYTSYILGQKVGNVSGGARVRSPSPSAAPATYTAGTPAVAGTDNSGLRRQLVGQFLQAGGVQNSNAVLGLAAQYGQAQDTPGTPAAYASTGGSAPRVKASGGSGAMSALQWAESKVNAPGSAESGGENHGKLADYANSRFGMSGQAWCAMFTSLAVTKGGAPKSARTASVAEVRAKALAGDGYQKGLIYPAQAKPGDLVLFGDHHIGMVKKVANGHLTYVGGNQSDSVTQAETGTSGVSVVRPKYGRKK